ncbi:MAG TPA: hypothetical protein VNS12_07290 [Pelagibacterium sp.]|uniref:hypothetical protein n=1 Tax=Pelagibacterium sp. TaxID=1967288 RepID=UPI002BC45954|nr:hypothetical protein [Pelagibacterium sp.]HWJ87857.1 hypothetical protein [Pelagibacterium sp.]
MQKTSMMLGSAVLALALASGVAALAEDIDFGDDSSTWAHDNQCDDPRFEGPGAAILRSPADELRDASDCRQAFEAGEVTLSGTTATVQKIETPDDIDFGDDSGMFAKDGECDDPRFGGTLASHTKADATDCRTAFEAGEVTLAPPLVHTGVVDGIDYGDDSGGYPRDGQCDDPRFTGTNVWHGANESGVLADATDCLAAVKDGTAAFTQPDWAPSSVGVVDGIDFGDDSGSWANDGECDDPRFGGSLNSHRLADASDCLAAYEAGEVTYQTPDEIDYPIIIDDIDFGDDSGNWAFDGECDDSRFAGSGVGVAFDDHLKADASDCSAAYQAGTVTLDDDTAGSNGMRINFGDDSGTWARDGECDDPRFGGSLSSHRLADATDCRAAYEAGEVTYIASDEPAYPIVIDGIDFGDDSGNWSRDNACDDPRFIGSGVGVALDDHLMADATDCSVAYLNGTVRLAGETGQSGDFRINFGDDSSRSAYDGVCDDPRFQGRGGALELLEINILSDATDCRAAYEAGTVSYDP